MHISSYSGAGTTQSLAQLARLLSQSSEASADTETQGATTKTSSAGPFSENESFFTGALSSGTFSGLLQAQEGQTSGQIPGQRPAGPPPGGGFAPPSLEDIDSDGDGSLTQTEMESWEASARGGSDTSRASELFGKMDTDGDGSVTAEEKSAFDDQMATQGPGRGGPPPGSAPQGAETSSEGTSAETLAALMQELMTALESYSSTATSDTQTATVSVAA
ncbi:MULTISPECIES: EF-hand domain-containing protein [Asticcacaulis]|uniref:EF-hand domain-containing protein n=1 Tax=Asticcacaulis TaxID=76890 RepID=UPI001AE75CF5|nr:MULTISPECIES: EF-hand domain-containing protein [Asticcacaulis]MBP2157982.1 hypothetical protein [Asticcacaulis solisilvae]MDR6799027.1 hypothetical protein [Asticcacaulis sp. BE141]